MNLPIENVQDYPRPPALEPVPQQIRIVHGGVVLAETRAAFRVLETHHAPTYYLPPDAFAVPLHPVSGGTYCEWKGVAQYWDIQAPSGTIARAAWSYPDPTAGFAPIADYLAVYATKVDRCFVGEMLVTPQPGDFYGGWVTPNLQGIVKGDAATRHW
ncbi:DUF427 domain-containing protein [Nereida sp. MMG025]|uniref:DUF427 domain-containing protein n=1 Tax=Nereida sp. MMG025 TaxID=2909981 RepID=UPI001F1EE245|nr:DUF427 domain-containing protein [Nereida sp. MMG025]MCF6445576.1 DUF427 domain-containing protein [Nereida sp. MMG025]